MYLGRRGHTYAGVIGSANLTFGLAGNYETGVLVDGDPAREAWTLGELLWATQKRSPGRRRARFVLTNWTMACTGC